MRAREEQLQGFIVNLLDRNLMMKCGEDGIQMTIPITGEYGSNCRTQFDGNFEPVGEKYGKLNGFFQIFYPGQDIGIEEKKEALSLEVKEPQISKFQLQRAQTYFIVSRATAIKAIAEDWKVKSQLLIPADSFVEKGEQVGRGFVLASLLKDCQ